MDAKIFFLAVICLGFSSTAALDVIKPVESENWMCTEESNEINVGKVFHIKKDASDYLVKIPFEVCKGLVITYKGKINGDWVFDLWEAETKVGKDYPFRMHVYFTGTHANKIAFTNWRDGNWGHARGENIHVDHNLVIGDDVTVQIKIVTRTPKGKFLVKVNDVEHEYEVKYESDLKEINYIRVHKGINLKTVEFSKEA